MSHSFLTFGCEPSAVVETERPSVCGSVLCGRYLLQEGSGGGKEREICVINILHTSLPVNISAQSETIHIIHIMYHHSVRMLIIQCIPKGIRSALKTTLWLVTLKSNLIWL